MTKKNRIVSVGGSFVALIGLIISVFYLHYKKLNYEFDIHTYAYYAGTLQATIDYSNGIKRQYVLNKDCKENLSSGKQEGDFEIWYTPYSDLNEFSKSIFVEGYNRRMQALLKEK